MLEKLENLNWEKIIGIGLPFYGPFAFCLFLWFDLSQTTLFILLIPLALPFIGILYYVTRELLGAMNIWAVLAIIALAIYFWTGNTGDNCSYTVERGRYSEQTTCIR